MYLSRCEYVSIVCVMDAWPNERLDNLRVLAVIEEGRGERVVLALRAAAAFPWVRSVGWDIAISEGGPVLVEGNERWSPSLIQMPAPHGLMTGEFKALYEALNEDEDI